MAEKPQASAKDRLYKDIENADDNNFQIDLPLVPKADLHTEVEGYVSMLAAATAANNHLMVKAILDEDTWTEEERLDARQTAISYATNEGFDLSGYEAVFELLGQLQPEHATPSAVGAVTSC